MSELETRSTIVLDASEHCLAVLCKKNGVLARGVLQRARTPMVSQYLVGGSMFRTSEVASITIERDLITIHLGEIA